MASKKDQIKLLENLHRSYSEAMSRDYSEETKNKMKNLLEMIEVVIKSLKKQKDETKIQKLKNRYAKTFNRTGNKKL